MRPRFIMGNEEGAMQLASDLVDLGLTWPEAEKEVKKLKGSENLQEVASRVIELRKNTETPPSAAN